MNTSQAPIADSASFYTLSSMRWQRFKHGYSLLGSLLVAWTCWITVKYFDPRLSHWAAIAIGLLVLTYNLVAFRLARIVAVNRIIDMQRTLELIQDTGILPPSKRSGWPLSDHLNATFLHMLCERDDRILALATGMEYYRRIAEHTSGIEAYFSNQGRLQWINNDVERKTGFTVDECITHSDIIDQLVSQQDQALLRQLLNRALHGEEINDMELRIQHRNGKLIWFYCRLSAVRDDDGIVLGAHLSAKNIQERKDIELELLETVDALRCTQALKEHYLAQSNEERLRLESLLDTVALGIMFVDQDKNIVYINQPAVNMWHLVSREQILNTSSVTMLNQAYRLLVEDNDLSIHIDSVINAELPHSLPHDNYFKDGRIIRDTCATIVSEDKKQSSSRLWVFEDVTETRQNAKHLTELSIRDPLTGLYNRRRFNEELTRLIADADRHNKQVGLLCMDLDRFKEVNDKFGHSAGDKVLLDLSTEINSIVRRNEQFFRLGGDEFAIIVEHADQTQLTQLARRILQKISEKIFLFNNVETVVTASIGIAIVPTHAQDPLALLITADRAMYDAKSQGKNQWAVAQDQEGSHSGLVTS